MRSRVALRNRQHSRISLTLQSQLSWLKKCQDDNTRSRTKQYFGSTMTKPNLALVGAGYWGKNLARNFKALDALHTLCDSNAEILAGYGEEYADVVRTSAFDEVISNPQIRRVAIATPAATHFELASAAIVAGKDVYVEKPLCLDTEEAAKLVRLAESYDRILMVGHLLQYHPYVDKLSELVSAGDLGRLQYITSNRLNLGKIRLEENSLWSFAPHDISVILRLAGGMPKAVSCNGESYVTEAIADTTLTQLEFGGSLRAHIYVSWLNPFKEQKITVVGSDGMAVFDDTKPWDEKLTVYRNYLTWTDGKIPTAQKNTGEVIIVDESEPLNNECRHFLNCCETRESPVTDGTEGLQVLQVLNAAQASLSGGGHAVPPAPKTSSQNQFFAHTSAVVDPGASIGVGTKIWHFSHISNDCEIGERCNLGQNVFISAQVQIGNHVKIQNNVSVYAGTTIEDDVFLGPSCVLTNVSNPRSEVDRRGLYEKTTIRRGATVGANATIVCGVTIGRFAFIAAGAVVTKDIPDYGFVRGVPARLSGWMSRHGIPLEFDGEGQAVCPESQLRFQLSDDKSRVTCIDLGEDSELSAELTTGSKRFREFRAESKN